jgi:hypothetical protein
MSGGVDCTARLLSVVVCNEKHDLLSYVQGMMGFVLQKKRTPLLLCLHIPLSTLQAEVDCLAQQGDADRSYATDGAKKTAEKTAEKTTEK